MQLSRVDDVVWFANGPVPDPAGSRMKLASKAISMVLALGRHAGFVDECGQEIQMRTVSMPSQFENAVASLASVVSVIQQHRVSTTGGILLICTSNARCSVTAVIAYLMQKECVGTTEALGIFRSRFPDLRVDPNPYWLAQLRDAYEHSDTRRCLKEISRITDEFFVSNFERSTDVEMLEALGVSCVFNITSEAKPDTTRTAYESAGIQEFCHSIEDGIDQDIVPVLLCVLEHLERLHLLRAPRRFLIHCHAGVSRSVSIMIGVLMHRRCLSYDAALELVRQQRVVAQPNEGFERQLRSWGASRGFV